MTADYSIVDQSRLSLKIRGRRIAAEDYLHWKSASEIVRQANQLLLEAQAEAEQIRVDARNTGYQEGVDQAFAELLSPILEAKTEARRILTSNLSQVVLLAESILRRIFPRLSQDKTISGLLEGALAEIRNEQQITVSVHPEHLTLARQTVKTWSASQAHRGELAVLADASMSRFTCVIRSELGEIQVGFEHQLQTVKDAALQAASQAEANHVIGA